MKKRVADYLADILVTNDIDTVFTVVGGGAMHLNDALGHHEQIQCIYHHHEQAASIAAEGYAKTCGRAACVCVTSGPGAINALNGVVGAYQDSVPMLVISGQTKTTLLTRNSGLQLRSLGNQEFDIISALSNMVKYSTILLDTSAIRYELEKAVFIASTGRPGPVWIDIPLDIQGAIIETDRQKRFTTDRDTLEGMEYTLSTEKTAVLADRILKSKRPIIYAGNGIRISSAVSLLIDLSHTMNIPVVTCWDSIDVIESQDNLYVGRAGTMGDRAGNFAVQNSDLLLCIGTRLNIYQVGYNVNTWARNAYVIMVDIDEEELKKPTIHVDLPICSDASIFIESLLQCLRDKYYDHVFEDFLPWIEKCREWKKHYPVIQEKHKKQEKKVNIYAFLDALSRSAGSDSVTIVANGSASVVGSQVFFIQKGQRFIMNCSFSSMGYDLPASIGASIARKKGTVICVAGDGSIQMNLQELQTIKTNALPIKVFVINNGGYHQIRLTQRNIFGNELVGVGPESGDLEFPEMERIAYAYQMHYFRIQTNREMEQVIDDVLEYDGSCICEVICDTEQIFEPKSSTKRKSNGVLYSPPLEDMAPFLSREEMKNNMIIPIIDE